MGNSQNTYKNQQLISKQDLNNLTLHVVYKNLNIVDLPDLEKQIKEHKKVKLQKLTFITYNVWFSKFQFENRVAEQFKIFKKYSPDFICLQEVTADYQKLLSMDKELMQQYYVSGNNINRYGVIILSKYPGKVYELPFKTTMGRSLLQYIIQVGDQEIVVSTTHLESMQPYESYRKIQLEQTFQQLQNCKNVLVMGDFNMDNEKENANIDQNYDDIWKSLRKSGDESHTFYCPKWRLDRICCKNSDFIKPEKIERIGMHNIPYFEQNEQSQKGEVQTPSDHYGLYAEFSLDFGQKQQESIQK